MAQAPAPVRFFARPRSLSRRIMIEVLALLACAPSALGATEVSGEPLEEVSLLSAFVMLGFLLVAALVVVSFVCKFAIALGLVPKSRTSRFGRIIAFLANATGDLRIVASARERSGGSRSQRGGGGSSGGAGASGDL